MNQLMVSVQENEIHQTLWKREKRKEEWAYSGGDELVPGMLCAHVWNYHNGISKCH
jgi:hypothetical protein